MLSTIFKGKTSSNESSASTGLWHLALNRLKSDRIAVVSFVIVLFYFILLALSMTGVIASNWNKEVAVSYAPPTFLGADTASSTDEIAGGLEKFAAVADTIGLSFDNAAAVLATITATTRQSEDVVGTALKTIFARIQGLKLGETLEDGTDLNKYSKALYKAGIDIKD